MTTITAVTRSVEELAYKAVRAYEEEVGTEVDWNSIYLPALISGFRRSVERAVQRRVDKAPHIWSAGPVIWQRDGITAMTLYPVADEVEWEEDITLLDTIVWQAIAATAHPDRIATLIADSNI